MYKIQVETEISAAHQLKLDYESPCSRLHGHNWKVVICCKSPSLDRNGMVVDFTTIKKALKERYDHRYLNDVFTEKNPTAENIAFDIAELVNAILCAGRTDARCYRVEVQEAVGNLAIWEQDEDE